MAMGAYYFDYRDFVALGLSRDTWAILLIGIFAICLISLWWDERKNSYTLQNKLDALEKSRPNIKYDNQITLQAPLINTRTGQQTGAPFFSTIRFVNEPLQPSESATGRKITAKITFYDLQKKELFSMFGRWSDTPEIAETGRFSAEMHEIDMPPFSHSRRLDIVLKHPGVYDCYAYNNESVLKSPDVWCDPDKRLMPGAYTFSVRLGGENYLGEFWFSLINPENKDAVRIQYLENYDATSF